MRRVAGLLFLLCGLTRPSPALEIGDRAGPVELLTLDGRSLIMTNYSERHGTAVVFLSARSEPVHAQLQALNELNSLFRLRDVLFVGVFPNAEETGEEVLRFAQHMGFIFPVYRDPERKIAQRFNVKVTPETCLLDARGALFYRGAVGKTKDTGLGQAIAGLLGGHVLDVKQVPPEGTPIGQPQAKRELPDPSDSSAFSSELVFEKIPDAPAHHCSTIVEAANGDLLILWYGGSYESADDQALFLSRRKKAEKGWSRPEALIRNSLQPPGNAVIFRLGGDRLCIVWARMEASRPLRRGGGWRQTRLFYRTSEDHGINWSKDQLFLNGVLEGLRNVPITLKSGTLLLPLGHSFALTKDSGRSWEHLGALTGGGQPTVIERSDGTLMTLLRKRPNIMQTESSDGGRNWSPPLAAKLKNPDSGIAMTGLSSGHLLLVFNDSESSRTPLSIARSIDEGRTWEPPLTLESNPGEYSYPCVIQTQDRKIHITYTFRRYAIKHVELGEAWLTRLHPPN